ncbi:DNA recombination protein RmuC [Patescibacteria group bacterium]|nr:DNA recombination protein RmuC [Patescibacteria group bacterium]MCG2809072.1 DNA recombination protein RmuC [Candidatus Portnoybacteria bacterium]
MEYFIISLLVLIILGLSIGLFLLFKKKSGEGNGESFLMLQQQLSQLSQAMDGKMNESARAIQEQSGQNAKIIRNVTERLTKLDDTNKQVMGFAEQLQSLENILTNPKQRGILGEYYLETVLKNVLPPSGYQMQYDLGDGEIVDAAVFIKDKILPIDSKFSLDNYNRIVKEKDANRRAQLEKRFKIDLKARIDETAKYIKPKKGTMDFAFMFIPSEGIYYDLLVNRIGAIKVNTRDLIEYAFQDRHVIIVSPTSFHAYLQTVLQGLRALQIEESAKGIRKGVEALAKHLNSYETYLQKMGSNLGTTVKMYNSAYKEFGKIDKDVMKITEGESKMKVKEIDKPMVE